MAEIIERRVSFNGGEISPSVEPRTDLEKYRSSCRVCENFRPGLAGGAYSRAGTVLVGAQANASAAGRLVGFEFNAATNLMLVFTDQEFTVYTTGDTPAITQVTNADTDGIWTTLTAYTKGTWIRSVGAPIGIFYCLVSHTSGVLATDVAAGKWVASTNFRRPTPYLAAELNELQFEQQNDLIFITHPNHQQRIISHFSEGRWTIAGLVQEWPATRDENISAVTLTAGGTTGSVTITASTTAATFFTGHIGSRWVLIHRRTDPWVKLVFGTTPPTESSALMVLGEWSLSVVSGSGTGGWDAVLGVQRSVTGTGSWETIRTISASRGDRSGLITGIELEPCFLRIILLDTTGAVPAQSNATLEVLDSNHYGIFEITGYTDAQHVTATVVFPLFGTGATTKWREGAWSDYRGWPRSIVIHEQRLFFGGNASQPQTIWGSVINDYYNFRIGSDDDLGLSLTLAGLKANTIQWLVSQETLLVGTSGEEGPLGSRDDSTTLTPSNSKRGRFTTVGSSFIQAVSAQSTVIFVNRPARKVWEMAFTFDSDGYEANDLTLLAEHIADDGGVIACDLQKNPETVLWCVTGGGQLAALVYERKQNVAGWFRYVTDGTFESVAVIGSDGEEDQVWVTVNRSTGRFIERFQPDRMRILKDATGTAMLANQSLVCSSDSSVIYDGAPATTITGLSHLNGKAVSVLADGAVVEGLTVAGGSITLEAAASVVIVGLPFTATLQPTWQETNDPGTLSKQARKRLLSVNLELWRTMGAEYSTNGGTTFLRAEFRSTQDLMDQAIPLYSGMTEPLVGIGSYGPQASPILRQRQPLPLNILSLHTKYDLNVPPS